MDVDLAGTGGAISHVICMRKNPFYVREKMIACVLKTSSSAPLGLQGLDLDML